MIGAVNNIEMFVWKATINATAIDSFSPVNLKCPLQSIAASLSDSYIQAKPLNQPENKP